MRLSVSTNFDDQLLQNINTKYIENFCGKLSSDFIGNESTIISSPVINQDVLARHVGLAKQQNIEFNYLLDGLYLGNYEFLKESLKKIRLLLDWIYDLEIEWVTVSSPYLVSLVKKHYPKLKISLSTFTYVDSLAKAIEFVELGVDEITLPEGLNRDFQKLEIFNEYLNCEIQLIATNSCLGSSPYRIAHVNEQCLDSQKERSEINLSDYYMLRCTEKFIDDPASIIKASWIRPEDLKRYEKIGIHKFKITEKMKKTEKILTIVEAYSNQKYKGDLTDLINIKKREDYLQLQTEQANTFKSKVQVTKNLNFNRKVTIDNQKLDGFIDFFVQKKISCQEMLCGLECRHCYKYFDKAVLIDADKDARLKNDLVQVFNGLFDGSFYEEHDLNWEHGAYSLMKSVLQMKPEEVQELKKDKLMLALEGIMNETGAITVEDVAATIYQMTPDEFKPSLLELYKEMASLSQILTRWNEEDC